jgi:hypothetical protein
MLLSVGSFYMLYVLNASVQMLEVAGSLLVSRTGLVFVVPGPFALMMTSGIALRLRPD